MNSHGALGLALVSTLATLGALLFAAAPALAANKTLKVEVEGPGTVFGPGIECGNGGPCETEAEEGTALTLNAGPTERGIFHAWTGCETVNGTECTLTVGASATEVTAEFDEIPQEQLTVSTEGEGAVNGTSPGGEFAEIHCGNGAEPCDAEYNQGATIILFASRDPHSKFTGWEECPNVLSSSEYGTSECEVTLGAATEVKAKFAPIPQAELEVTVEGSGEVTSSPGGIACASGTCKEHFDTEGPEATVTLFATASPDNHFEKWEGGGCSGNRVCEVMMSAARSLKADFAATFHTLTAAPSGPGEVSVTSPASGIAACTTAGGTCAGSYQEGSAVILTAEPGDHHHVAWAGCTPRPNLDECELTIGGSDETVNVEFPINEHTLTVSRTGLGSITASTGAISNCSAAGGTCSGIYDEAFTVTLTAAPAAHKYVEWEGCTHQTGDTCEIEIGPTNTLVKAAFPGNLQTLTVTPTGQGTVKATSGSIRNCSASGGTCSGTYIEAATAVLVATPAPGQAVAWQGCTALPAPNTCDVEISASGTAVEAAFTPITHTLTLVKAGTGQGAVTCDGAPCGSTYPKGTVLTLTATPSVGSTFAGWSGGGCSGTAACQITLQTDATVTATFSAHPPPPVEEEKKPSSLLCRKGFAKKNGRCVRKPKPRHHKKKR